MSDRKLLIKASLFSAMCSILITIILSCIFAVVMLTTGLLPEYILPFATVAMLAAGTFLGGFISARITKSAGLITGLVTGFIIFFLVTVVGIVRSNDSVTIVTLVRFIATMLAGGLGGIVGVNKKEKLKI